MWKCVEVSASDLRVLLIITSLSIPRRRQASVVRDFWIPAFAGMTFLEVALNIDTEQRIIGAGILSVNGLINPSTFPGLKPGVCSGLILSGAFHSTLKDGVWRRRSIKTRG